MQKLDYLLVKQIEAFVRDYYEEEVGETNEETIVADIVRIIKYMLSFNNKEEELKDYMDSILALLGLEEGCSSDFEIIKIFQLEFYEERTPEQHLNDIYNCLYLRNDFCFNMLKDLLAIPVSQRDPNIDYEEVETLYYYFESYLAGNTMRVLFLNEIDTMNGLNDHAQIVRYVLEDIGNRPIN